jgi:hypothetical protein
MIKFFIFNMDCILKFNILLIIRNTILLIVCSSLLCWSKKELQGHQPMKTKISFTPHPTSMAPSRTTTPSRAHSPMTTLGSHAPSTSSTLSKIVPHAMDPSKASILQRAGTTKPSSSTVSTGRTSDIMCHRCHGIGHFRLPQQEILLCYS